MAPPILPGELIDAIIDIFHKDQPALSLCALVCKSWVPTSRYHSFMQIHVKERNTQKLIELLQSEWETISYHIRAMIVQLSPGSFLSLNMARPIPGIVSSLAAELPIVSLFNAMAGRVVLTSLTFMNIDFTNAKSMLDVLPTIYSTFSSVAYLTIWSNGLLRDESDSNSQTILQSFLDSFPRLEAFWVADPNSFWPLRLPQTVRILCLSLPIGEHEHAVERICSQTPSLRLSVLHISSVSNQAVGSINTLLKCMADTLEHLSLEFAFGPDIFDVIDLAPLLRLRTLRFSLAENSQVSAPITSLISACPTHLRAVTIRTRSIHNFPSAPDWVTLDRTLSNETRIFSPETKVTLETNKVEEIMTVMPLSVASETVEFIPQVGSPEAPSSVVWRTFVPHVHVRN